MDDNVAAILASMDAKCADASRGNRVQNLPRASAALGVYSPVTPISLMTCKYLPLSARTKLVH
jgi:hypothetical protein